MNFKKNFFFSILLIFFSKLLYAQQGNYNFQNFGNKSILLSGNVTGSVEDLAVSYYNPARLSTLDNNTFSVNAKAYQLNKLRLNDVIGNGTTFKDSEFKGIPSMIGGTFKLKGQQFAYALLSKSSHETNLNYGTKLKVKDILDEFPGEETFTGGINIQSKFSEEWLGLSWAKEVTNKFSFGVSVFFSIFEEQGASEFDYTIIHSQNQLVATYENSVDFEQTSYGVFVKAGVHYKLNKATLGLTVSLPHIGVWNDGDFSYREVVAGIGSGTDRFVTASDGDLKAARRTPFSIAVGSGIAIGKHKLHLNTAFFTGVKSYSRIEIPPFQQDNNEVIDFQFEESMKPIINFGAGTELYITKSINGYLSFATDYSAYTSNANLFDLNSLAKKDTNFSQNFYHFGAGFELKLQSLQLILGATYTRSSSDFSKPIDIESEIDKDSSYLFYQQWQFIVGIEIPMFSEKLKLK